MRKLENQKFVDSSLYTIRGFIHPTDAILFSLLLENQAENGFKGNLAEIGVFFGRSYALMALNCAEGEVAAGLDLFDIPGQRAYLDEVLAKYGLTEKTSILPGNSLEIPAQDLLEKYGKIRFFSVDGGHEREHLMGDGNLAMDVLSDEGIIAFDDFMNAQYPDLSVAVADILRERSDEFRPFCVSSNKLYVARTAYAEHYMKAIQAADLRAGVFTEQFQFLETQVLGVRQSLINRIIFQKSAELGFGAIGRFFTRERKRQFKRE